jgi:anti-anti-sigma factor
MIDTQTGPPPVRLALAASPIFTLERHDDTLLVEVHTDLRETLYQEIAVEAAAIFHCFLDPSLKHLIVDFAGTDFFGSSAVGLLLRLRRKVNNHGGRMALCRLSEHETEVLRITELDRLWTVYSSWEEALNAIQALT